MHSRSKHSYSTRTNGEELKALKGEAEKDGEKTIKRRGGDIKTNIYQDVF
ncbi:hypothetical protein HanHA300_Chr16g0622461 [Helianthus annuus]|nr:hypothetical protein HanHA300_Chr16g0622461 [Helianthus annuus]KAJ0461536.1 hypothetical protein HanHA89_Chr16g0673351 [Helianthus annuus]